MFKKQIKINKDEDLIKLIKDTRVEIKDEEYDKCEKMLYQAMSAFPHAPEPHNLLGILLEKKGDHLMAMRHFRAASELDPTYSPARVNLSTYGAMAHESIFAYDESDIASVKAAI